MSKSIVSNPVAAIAGRKTLIAAIAAIVGSYAERKLGIQLPEETWAGIAALGAWGLVDKSNKAIAAFNASHAPPATASVESPPPAPAPLTDAERKTMDELIARDRAATESRHSRPPTA